MISIISPIYNEENNIVELCNRIANVLHNFADDYEIILVENGSTDNSLKIIKELSINNKRIKYLSLSRNFGHQGGILAGLAHAKGDAVISMDGDLQHPPEIIPQMIELWKKGYKIVVTTKKLGINHKGWRFLPTLLFYKIINVIADIKLSYGQSDFRLLDQKIVDVLVSIPEKDIFLRGLVDWTGFSQTSIKYNTEPRKSGNSKFSFINYMRFALDGIFSFSNVPLKLFLWLGLFISFLCFLYGIFVVFIFVFHSLGYEFMPLPPGWATIALGLVFFGSIQLIGIGLLGEYIGRIFKQVKQRPDFIIKESNILQD